MCKVCVINVTTHLKMVVEASIVPYCSQCLTWTLPFSVTNGNVTTTSVISLLVYNDARMYLFAAPDF